MHFAKCMLLEKEKEKNLENIYFLLSAIIHHQNKLN